MKQAESRVKKCLKQWGGGCGDREPKWKWCKGECNAEKNLQQHNENNLKKKKLKLGQIKNQIKLERSS